MGELFKIFDSIKDPVIALDPKNTIVYCNQATAALTGYTREEILSRGASYFEGLNAETEYSEALIQKKDGNSIEVGFSLSVEKISGGEYKIVILRDISDIKASHLKMEEKLQHAADIAVNAPVGILTCDEEGKILYLNNMVADLLGSPNIEETKLINLFTFPLLVDCGFSVRLRESMSTNSHVNYELNYESKWGRRIWLNVHNKPFFSKGKKLAMIIIDDLTERKNIENQLTSLSYTDTLTGIYNRRYFMRRAEEEIILAKQLTRSFSIIMLDLDHFKSVNDHFGHEVGDVILKTITSCIMEKIRKSDTLARWGGEEFIVLLTDISYSQAIIIAEKLRKHLMMTDISPVGSVTASFGVAAYGDGDTLEDMIQRVDKMLYCAKSEGRNCVR
jgi:diguanylate cyclase (GGDEF)-like protein/PAS domain S-box-containing protein